MFWELALLAITAYMLFRWLRHVPKIGNINHKCVFITGCDSGFGRETVKELDKVGFHVFAGCFTEDGRRHLETVCSDRLVTVDLDVRKEESVQAALEVVKSKLQNGNVLWGVINNAGVAGTVASPEMCTKKEYQEVLDVNFFGPILVNNAFLPLLRKSKGRVVNIVSIMGRLPWGPAPYCSSKYAMEAYSDVLRRDLGLFGMNLVIIEPGFFNTSLFQINRSKEQIIDAFKNSPLDVQQAYGEGYVKKISEGSAMMRLIWSHDVHKVADACRVALTARFPRPRIQVGLDAKLVYLPLSYMPEWVTDSLWWLCFFKREHGVSDSKHW